MTLRAALLIVLLANASFTCLGQSHVHPGSPVGDPAPASGVKEVTPEELSALMRSAVVFIGDVNEDFMYNEAHVPGAVLMVYDAITADKLPSDRQTPLAFYCYSPECPAGGMAAESALALGFVNVYHMKAGITGWQDVGLPTEP